MIFRRTLLLLICAFSFSLTKAQDLENVTTAIPQCIDLLNKEDYKAANKLLDKWMGIYEKKEITSFVEYGTMLFLKTLCMYRTGHMEEAYTLGMRAYDAKSGLSVFDEDYELLHTVMKNVCSHLQLVDEEIEWAEKAHALKRQRMNMDPVAYINSIRVLAETYFIYQQYAKARPLYMEYFIRALAQNTFDTRRQKDIEVFVNIAMASFYLADYDFAIENFHTALQAYEKLNTDYAADKSLLHCSLAECYVKQGRYALASMELEKAKAINKEHHLKGEQVMLMTQYADNLLGMQEDPVKALKLWAKIYPEKDNGTGMSLNARIMKNAGICAFNVGEYELAKEVFMEALTYMEKYGMTGDDDYYDALYQLMLAIVATEDGENASSASSLLNELTAQNIYTNFPLMSESTRASYWERYSSWLSDVQPRLTVYFDTPELRRNAYSGLLMSKGMLLRSAISLQDYIMRTGNEYLEEMQQQVMYHKRKIQRLQADDEANSNALFQAQLNMERLQQRILGEVKENFMADIYIDVDSVRKALRPGDVAIEFMAIENVADEADSVAMDTLMEYTRYYALVLKANYDAPHLIPLCTDLQLNAAGSKAESVSADLYKAVWQPLEEEIKGTTCIFFSPDGMLHNLPIEYCPVENGGVFSEQHECYRLSSTRLLASHPSTVKTEKDAIIFGDIDYNKASSTVPKAAVTPADNAARAVRSSWYYRGASEVQNKSFVPLPFAKEEIEGIDTILSGNNVKGNIKKKGDATEEAFKTMQGDSPAIVHLCTHGYFIPKDHADWDIDIPVSSEDAAYITQEDEAMSRCGLVMAGANDYLFSQEHDPQKEDGFLTAREISRMNLSGTDIVVLSACETGLGDISSEGVFGLQRGLKKAGVGAILMSLWEVNDKATSKLMTEFYSNWIGLHQSKHQALENAKRTIRSTKGWTDPQYWAAFILLDGLD